MNSLFLRPADLPLKFLFAPFNGFFPDGPDPSRPRHILFVLSTSFQPPVFKYVGKGFSLTFGLMLFSLASASPCMFPYLSPAFSEEHRRPAPFRPSGDQVRKSTCSNFHPDLPALFFPDVVLFPLARGLPGGLTRSRSFSLNDSRLQLSRGGVLLERFFRALRTSIAIYC